MNVEQVVLEGQLSGGLINFIIEAGFPPEHYSQYLKYSLHVHQFSTFHLSIRLGRKGFRKLFVPGEGNQSTTGYSTLLL